MKIDLKLKDALVNSATQQNRSLANLVETVLFEYLSESKPDRAAVALYLPAMNDGVSREF